MRKCYVITGASSGLGKCISDNLTDAGCVPINWDFGLAEEEKIDVSSTRSIENAKKTLIDFLESNKSERMLSGLINCAGVNTPTPFDELTDFNMQHAFNVNAVAHMRTTKALLPLLCSGVVCNIISNASHTPMNNSLAYNASKAAAHMVTLQMARELGAKHNVTIFGVSPNKLTNTAMTENVDRVVARLKGMTREEARDYQLSKLAIGEETDPEAVAELIVWLLTEKRRHRYLHGCVIPYGA